MRKEIDIVITDGKPETNRDHGKIFHIREMGAEAAEWWAIRAILALGQANPDIEYDPGMGMQALAMIGIRSFFRLNPMDLKPLLDEMMACVTIKPDPKQPLFERMLLEEDIQEIGTRLRLRSEVFTLHTGFSMPGRR